MRFKFLLFISILINISSIILEKYSVYILLSVICIIAIRNLKFLGIWLVAILPGAFIYILISYFTLNIKDGLFVAIRLYSISCGFLLYFGFFKSIKIGVLLSKSGLPSNIVFVISSAVIISVRVLSIYTEVRDTQRLRGIEIKPSIRYIHRYPALLIPILIKSLKYGEDIGISIYQRGKGYLCSKAPVHNINRDIPSLDNLINN